MGDIGFHAAQLPTFLSLGSCDPSASLAWDRGIKHLLVEGCRMWDVGTYKLAPASMEELQTFAFVGCSSLFTGSHYFGLFYKFCLVLR